MFSFDASHCKACINKGLRQEPVDHVTTYKQLSLLLSQQRITCCLGTGDISVTVPIYVCDVISGPETLGRIYSTWMAQYKFSGKSDLYLYRPTIIFTLRTAINVLQAQWEMCSRLCNIPLQSSLEKSLAVTKFKILMNSKYNLE
jgi:hypothetical protein